MSSPEGLTNTPPGPGRAGDGQLGQPEPQRAAALALRLHLWRGDCNRRHQARRASQAERHPPRRVPALHEGGSLGTPVTGHQGCPGCSGRAAPVQQHGLQKGRSGAACKGRASGRIPGMAGRGRSAAQLLAQRRFRGHPEQRLRRSGLLHERPGRGDFLPRVGSVKAVLVHACACTGRLREGAGRAEPHGSQGSRLRALRAGGALPAHRRHPARHPQRPRAHSAMAPPACIPPCTCTAGSPVAFQGCGVAVVPDPQTCALPPASAMQRQDGCEACSESGWHHGRSASMHRL